jgi:hypothetical protein
MSATEAATDPKPSRTSGLLGLVRQLIDYGRQLAATLRGNPHRFGTSDIALILARITSGLLRAEALEARIIRGGARLDAAPGSPRAASHRRSPPARAATDRPTDTAVPGVDPGILLPTPEQIAAEVRRRPMGAVIADICRDLGITPSHPLWRELRLAIIRFGGSLAPLVRGICEWAVQRTTSGWPPDWPAFLQAPEPSGAGPP